MDGRGEVLFTMALSGGLYVGGKPTYNGTRADVYLWAGGELRQLTNMPGVDHRNIDMNERGEAVWLGSPDGNGPMPADMLTLWNGQAVTNFTQPGWHYKLPRIGDGGQVAFVISQPKQYRGAGGLASYFSTAEHVILWNGVSALDLSGEVVSVSSLCINKLGHVAWAALIRDIATTKESAGLWYWNGAETTLLPGGFMGMNDSDQIALVEGSPGLASQRVMLWEAGTKRELWHAPQLYPLVGSAADNSGHWAWTVRNDGYTRGGGDRGDYLLASDSNGVYFLGRLELLPPETVPTYRLRNGWLAWNGILTKDTYALMRTRFPTGGK